MRPIKFPTPMVGLAVTPKSRGDEGKLSGALHKIVEEDSTVHLDRDPQTKELVMTGMSELHLTVIRERLRSATKWRSIPTSRRFPTAKRSSKKRKAATATRSKPAAAASSAKFTSACTRSRSAPRSRSLPPRSVFRTCASSRYDEKNNFLWVDSIVGGTIPNNFLPAVEKGFKERMERGVIAGYHVQNVGVEVHFGKYHDVDSSEAAFKTAGSMAFRNMFQQAKPCAAGADRHAARHGPRRQARRHQQRHVRAPRPRAGHGDRRRRHADRQRARCRWPK